MIRPTRRNRVLNALRERRGEWVPGMQIMNAEVGGTRAGGRIHELIAEGHVIESRPDPTGQSAVWQYRYVSGPNDPIDVPPGHAGVFVGGVAIGTAVAPVFDAATRTLAQPAYPDPVPVVDRPADVPPRPLPPCPETSCELRLGLIEPLLADGWVKGKCPKHGWKQVRWSPEVRG